MSGLYQRRSQSLGGLLDVDLVNSTNDEVLTYENELWKNKPAGGAIQPIFGSFDISGSNFNLTTNQYTTITALKEQEGVSANGMSVNSATGIITLNTSGLYLLNAGFTIGQQGGGGGLDQAYLYVTDSANNAIKLIATFSDEAGATPDRWRAITLAGHAVIPAPTSPYQIMFRALGSTNGSLTSIRNGTTSSGVSILKIA